MHFFPFIRSFLPKYKTQPQRKANGLSWGCKSLTEFAARKPRIKSNHISRRRVRREIYLARRECIFVCRAHKNARFGAKPLTEKGAPFGAPFSVIFYTTWNRKNLR